MEMKKYVLFLLVTLGVISCTADRKDKSASNKTMDGVLVTNDSTTVQIIDSSYDFGVITDGEKVSYNFRFKNSGTKPLVIVSASSSCGCTVPEKPEEPVLPGQIGFIKVVFDSKGKAGSTHKLVKIMSNADPAFPDLILTGQVLEKK